MLNEIKLKDLIVQNKKGIVLSIWWFFIVMAISLVFYLTTNLFYSSPIDVRDVEVNSLINKAADCIYYAGRFKVPLPSSNEPYTINKDFLEENCNFIFTDENYENTKPYYLEVNIYKLKPKEGGLTYEDNKVLTYIGGDEGLKIYCDIQLNPSKDEKSKDNDYSHLPLCKNKKFYAFSREFLSDGSRDEYIVEIIGGISKIKQNVKE